MRERAPRRHIRGGPLVVPVCTAAALQRYELALSSRARAVPSSSILDAVASGRPSPPDCGRADRRLADGRRVQAGRGRAARGAALVGGAKVFAMAAAAEGGSRRGG